MIKRDIHVDLFRVIATLFVIVLHVLGQGGILKNAVPDGATYLLAWFLEICAYCAVNGFALITGYVMVDKRIKVKNLIALWLQVIFYSLLFSGVFFAFVPESRSLRNLVVAVLPITGKQWWYVYSYFALFFSIPFLNEAIKHISRDTYRKFLLVVLVGVGCLDCVIPIDAFAFKEGYSAIWLMLAYLFGAYIKKYELAKKITAGKSILVFWAMVTLTFASKILIRFVTRRIFGEVKFEDLLVSYTSVTILLSAIFLFLFCLKIKVNHTAAKIIGFLSPATLGVYLIHVHPLVFGYIMKDAFVSFAYKSAPVMLLCVLVATVVIFFGCSAMELLRIWTFKIMKIGKLCEWADCKINRIYIKLFHRG